MDEERFDEEYPTNLTEKEIKEVEATLRRYAAKIDPGDFEERYRAIRDSLPPRKKRRLRPGFWRLFVPILSSLCTGLLVMGIMMPFALAPEKRELYYFEQLGVRLTNEADYYRVLRNFGIRVNPLPGLNAKDYKVYMTRSNKVMGGEVEYYEGDVSDYYLRLQVLDRRVELHPDPFLIYDRAYEKNGASIDYCLIESDETQGPERAYEYKAFGTFRTQTYVIDYVSLTDNVTEVFDELFK